MAEQLKKTRSELKSFFVPNAIPTADDYAAIIESAVNQVDDGVRVEAGNLTVSGAVEAKAGLTVTGAPVTIGASNDKQPLTVHGALTITDGFNVYAGSVALNTSAMIAGQLDVSGQVNAQGNLAVTGALTAVGGPVTIGNAGTNLPMTVHHTLTVNREVTLNKGLAVRGASASIGEPASPQDLTVSGATNLQAGVTIQNGLSVPTGAVAFGSAVTANLGLTVKGGAVTIGEPTANQDLSVNGQIHANNRLNVSNGLFINSGGITVNGGVVLAKNGLQIDNGPLTVGTASSNQNVIVQGTVTAKTLALAPPPGDPSPILTARAIPGNQGGSNEATELLIFHGDDYTGSGYGPDLITLRAPAIRLQTYGSVGAVSIDNAATSNTRFFIDSNNAMTASGPLTVTGLVTANAGLAVLSGTTTLNGSLSVAHAPRTGNHLGAPLGAYITGDFADGAGVEIRHTNGTQGIGLGLNTIYATGSNTDQVLRLKPRGASPVEVLGNLNVTGTLSGPANDYTKAQFTLTGGGTVTWSGGRLKWSNRFLAVSAGKSPDSMPAGYVNILMPTVDIPAANVYDGVARSVNANGILLNAWEALYAVHTIGENHTAVTLRIVHHNTAHTVPSNWLLIALKNQDDQSIKLGTGQTILDGNRVVLNGPLETSALVTANAGLTVAGIATINGALSLAQVPRSGTHPTSILGAYITGEFGEAWGVEFRHSNGTQGIGFGYNTIYATGSGTDQPLRLKARGASSVEILGNLNISGSLSGPPNDYLRAQFTLSGGGTVTWSGGRLKWTARFLAISMGVTSSLPAGHINVNMPTTDIPAANVWDGVARSVNASGILLKPYEALYAVHAPGSPQDAVHLRIVIFNSPHSIPANWILVAVMNNDEGSSIKLGTGQIIQDGNKLNVTGQLTVGGVVNANAGMNVNNGPLAVGTPAVNQFLTVHGTTQAKTYTFPALPGDRAPYITARTIPANQGPQGASNEASELILFHSNDPSGTHAGPDCITLRAPELRLQTYNDHNVSDIDNVAGANTRLLIDSDGAITTSGTLKVGQLLTAQNGLIVASGGMHVAGVANFNTGLTVHSGPVWSNGLVTANAGLTVNTGPLYSNSHVTANAGLTVANGALWSNSRITANDGLTIANGDLWSNVRMTANAGLTIANGDLYSSVPVTANAGLIVNNGPVMIGPSAASAQLVVNGTARVTTLTFPPPPGDPAPVITARSIPGNQGGTNEATELILFHSNDGFNASGPDYITLRAPALRFQTYNDANVSDINNPAGSQTRMYIEPTGAVNMYQGLVRLGTQPGIGHGQVSSAIGFMAPGVSHGQLAYRAGFGFELVDVSSSGALLSYGRDQFPYTDLRLKQIQFQSQAQFSSRTLKEDIRDLTADQALDAFQHLQPVTYRLKADSTGRTHAGFIAEDVPDLVSQDEHKAIAPVDILAVLTRVVHLQQEAIQRLEAQIAALTPA